MGSNVIVLIRISGLQIDIILGVTKPFSVDAWSHLLIFTIFIWAL